MMQALVAGGLEAVTDQQRAADDDNPVGYYELEAVKQLPRGNHCFLDDAPGKVIKVIHALLKHLPSRYKYQIIFMMRDLREVVASQQVMLQRSGKAGAALSETQLITVLTKQRADALAWLESQPNCSVIEVDHAQIIADPASHMNRINRFLGDRLDAAAMAQAVDPKLRHHQK